MQFLKIHKLLIFKNFYHLTPNLTASAKYKSQVIDFTWLFLFQPTFHRQFRRTKTAGLMNHVQLPENP